MKLTDFVLKKYLMLEPNLTIRYDVRWDVVGSGTDAPGYIARTKTRLEQMISNETLVHPSCETQTTGVEIAPCTPTRTHTYTYTYTYTYTGPVCFWILNVSTDKVSKGILNVSTDMVLDTDLAPNGFNYASVTVHTGATLRATGSNPLIIHASSVNILGTIDVSGGNGGNSAGDHLSAGGGAGGAALKSMAETIAISAGGAIRADGGDQRPKEIFTQNSSAQCFTETSE